ncbi:hypothetical protein H6G89_29995 [Oscillatoria sp. FACHB-1407]|uniref:hypothetical protein n=1 Tax=Oscillatoria sp. FACHB-1407 TaxID=2692847 RepID=UPI001682F72F|nr:hypothetical protein [Oscillatoria sp. FACHB-1407]MBD2465246.1 hypothetical protein [Oscillatoria sp. FACHB-1407]
MKRFAFAGLSALMLNSILVPVAFAFEVVDSKSNLPEQYTTTFDTRDLGQANTAEKSSAKPPSGDANPSDLYNSTVDTSEIINPQPDR